MPAVRNEPTALGLAVTVQAKAPGAAALTGAAVIPTKRLAIVANATTTPSIFIDNLLFIDFF
jgi:hypothetical protein